MDDYKKLDELQKQLVPTPQVDLSMSEEEPDATEQVVDAMNK